MDNRMLASIHGLPDCASRRTVLYVDDTSANQELVAALLARRADVALLLACSGEDGIVQALASLPDVIVMDIKMPGMGGMAALQILRSHSATAHIPVIALSSNAYPRQIELGLQAGFFRYMTKPFLMQEFLNTLDSALSLAAAHQAH
jgi:CheY-like chemotaxis protein